MEPPEKKIQQQLPEDIWYQILLRLPAITVIELKSVCKSWCELINNENFQISHVDHWRIRVSAETKSQLVTLCQSPPALLTFEPVSNDDIDIPSKLHSRPLTFDLPLRRSQRRLSGPPESETTVFHSDDGLLLVRMENQLFLCNPLTKSYLYLPFPKRRIDEIHDYTWTSVYEPSSRGYVILCVDISYTSRMNTVYLLRIELNDSGCSGQKIRAWRRVWSPEKQTLSTETTSLFFEASMSIHGKAYFLFTFRCNDTGILTIDAATEESTVTECSGAKPSYFFKSSREFYGLNESSSGDAFELWVIDDVHNPTWSKRHVIMNSTFCRIYRFSNNIMILKEGDCLIVYSRFWGCVLKSVLIYYINLDKCQEVDFVGNHPIQKLMPINYSLLSLTN